MGRLENLVKSCWLETATKQCAERLQEQPEIDAFESKAGDLISDCDEIFQVKVIVTRKQEDFIGDFDFVEHVTKKL